MTLQHGRRFLRTTGARNSFPNDKHRITTRSFERPNFYTISLKKLKPLAFSKETNFKKATFF